MTRQKSKIKKNAAVDLRSEFLKLSKDEQEFISHFFALHNAAQTFYRLLSEDAQNYVNYCINLTVDANKTEKLNSAQG